MSAHAQGAHLIAMIEVVFIIAETAAVTHIISLTVSSAIVKQVPSVI